MRLSVRTKIFIIILFILSVVLSLIYYDLVNQLSDQAYQRIQTSLSKELNLAISYVEKSYFKASSVEIMDVIADDLGEYLDVRVTIIINKG